MTKQNQDFTMWQGEDKILEVTVKDESDVVVNLTGATIKWVLAPTVDGTVSITKETGGSGIVITDATNGVFQVTINAADTASLEGTFYHEAEVTSSASKVSKVLIGKVIIRRAAA